MKDVQTEPDYGMKEFCGNCGAKWTGKVPDNNGFCCAVPFFQNSEYCPACMGTGETLTGRQARFGEGLETTICAKCKGTGEKDA